MPSEILHPRHPASQRAQYNRWSARGMPVTPAKKNVSGATPAKLSRASAVGDRPPQSISIAEQR